MAPNDEKPSQARLDMSRSRRLRQLAQKAEASMRRYIAKSEHVKAQIACREMCALDAGADALQDRALAAARATGESLQ